MKKTVIIYAILIILTMLIPLFVFIKKEDNSELISLINGLISLVNYH